MALAKVQLRDQNVPHIRSSLIGYDKIYIGQLFDVATQFIYHYQWPKNGWTSRYRPWVLVHLEVFEEKNQALRREKQLKVWREGDGFARIS